MELVFRAGFLYICLLIVFRIAGRRTLANTSTFDFVLLLVISEAVQQALFGSDDPSITSALVVVLTLVVLDVAFSLVKSRSSRAAKWLDGLPLVLIAAGKVYEDRLRMSRIDVEDVLSAAREKGYRSLKQIEYAVLEASGTITIIPWERERLKPDDVRESADQR